MESKRIPFVHIAHPLTIKWSGGDFFAFVLDSQVCVPSDNDSFPLRLPAHFLWGNRFGAKLLRAATKSMAGGGDLRSEEL